MNNYFWGTRGAGKENAYIHYGPAGVAAGKRGSMGTILLLEDEESVNRGIAFTLEKEGHTVFSCKSIKEAELSFLQHKPQMLICDITLPDGSGLDFVKKVRARGNAYIICLTALDGEMDYVLGYEAGADDYIAKPFSLSVLSLKVQAHFGRRTERQKQQLVSGNFRVDLQDMRAFHGEEEISFTKNEWKLVLLFLRNPNRILSKAQMVEQLFDAGEDFVDENTIAVNIRRLREKIEPDPSKPEYIKNVRGVGYVWIKECVKS